MSNVPYQTQNLYQRIIARQGHYETKRQKYDDQNDVICELFRPDLVRGLIGQKEEGLFDNSKIVEGTGPYSLQIWQRGFLGNMITRKADWFRDKLEEPEPWRGITFDGMDEVNTYLQDLDDHLSAMYRKSNYYDVMPEFVLDGGSVGSAVMLREYDPLEDRIVCKVPDYASRWLDKDIFGYDNCLHVKWRWSALQAAAFFGKDNLPLAVKNQFDNGNHYDETEYIQAIYGAGDPIFEGLEESQSHPWLEYFVCCSAGETEQEPLEPLNKGPGYFTRPFSSWHYHRNWHEVYSRTKAWFAVYDVRGANAYWEALFSDAELNLRPPSWAMRTLRGLLDLSPGGENYARTAQEYENPPVYLQRPGNWAPAVDFADRLKASIERWFDVPLFMMISQLAQSRNQPETKYGLMRMEAERVGQVAPAVETYEGQVLKNNHDAFMDIERSLEPAYPWGRLPEPPPVVQAHSNGRTKVEFMGQLSMAQVRDREILNFYRNLGTAEAVFTASPETINKIRWPQALERVLEAGNFPQSELVPQDEYEQIIEAMRQRAMQQELAEQAPKMAQAAKNLQGKTEEGSPLKAMAG